ncbi:MAG: helix-turn-helix transcriptional regulator, partial [Pseudomonadota bacterium]
MLDFSCLGSNFAKVLRYARTRKMRLSVEKFAGLAGVSPELIKKFERGEGECVKLITLAAIAQAANMTLETMVGEIEDLPRFRPCRVVIPAAD